jgi:hypothetical protein
MEQAMTANGGIESGVGGAPVSDALGESLTSDRRHHFSSDFGFPLVRTTA